MRREIRCGLSDMRLAVGQEAVQLPHWMQVKRVSTSAVTCSANDRSRCSSVQ